MRVGLLWSGDRRRGDGSERADAMLGQQDRLGRDGRLMLKQAAAGELSRGGGRYDPLLLFAGRGGWLIHLDLTAGARWRDPDRVQDWIAELSPEKPLIVDCSYGFDVGRNGTTTLIARGLDAGYLRGGLAAWSAARGARSLETAAG